MFLTAPVVYLIAATETDQVAVNDFLVQPFDSNAPSPAEYLVEFSGRLCYDSYKSPRPGGNQAYLDHIKEARHGSVLEHTSYSFAISGVSRSLTHELVRHRAGTAFSQQSQRYVDESYCNFVVPPELLPHPELVEIFKESCLKSQIHYTNLVSQLTELLSKDAKLAGIEISRTELRKRARQSARAVLPNATETKIVLTANGRALRHMIEMRASRHADTEIRRLFNKIFEVVKKVSPNLFSDYQTTDLLDGTYEITTPNGKV